MEENSFNTYRSQLNGPLLTESEEHNLARLAREGDPQAREELITRNLRYVLRVANYYASPYLDYEDLVAAGNEGLVKAADNYDPSYGQRFVLYAVWWIRESILAALNNERLIRLPGSQLAKMRKLRAFSEQDLSITELSELSGVPEEDAKRLLELHQTPLSLEQPLYEGEALSLRESLIDSREPPSEAAAMSHELLRILEEAMEKHLTKQEHCVLRMHFGLTGEHAMQLSEIGLSLGVSKERVRCIVRQALAKLRCCPEGEQMRSFLQEEDT